MHVHVHVCQICLKYLYKLYCYIVLVLSLQLNILSNQPPEDFVFTEPSYNALQNLTSDVSILYWICVTFSKHKFCSLDPVRTHLRPITKGTCRLKCQPSPHPKSCRHSLSHPC